MFSHVFAIRGSPKDGNWVKDGIIEMNMMLLTSRKRWLSKNMLNISTIFNKQGVY
jgi:hypothetical protein